MSVTYRHEEQMQQASCGTRKRFSSIGGSEGWLPFVAGSDQHQDSIEVGLPPRALRSNCKQDRIAVTADSMDKQRTIHTRRGNGGAAGNGKVNLDKSSSAVDCHVR